MPVVSPFPAAENRPAQRDPLDEMLAMHRAGSTLQQIGKIFHVSVGLAACLLAERSMELNPPRRVRQRRRGKIAVSV